MSLQLKRPQTFRAITGGRAIKDPNPLQILTSRSVDNQTGASFQYLNLQRKNLFRLPFKELKKIAFKLSPELKQTQWSFLRYCNPGYIIESETDQAQRATEEFIQYLTDIHGSFDNLLETSFNNLFKYGRTLKELVLSEDTRTPIDVYIPSPDIIEFRKVDRGSRGVVWVLGYQGKNGWEPLEDDGIFYLALDAEPDNPYGESLSDPAVYDAVILLLVKQATQRVFENAGFARQDFAINTEMLLQLFIEEEENLTDQEADNRASTLIKRFVEEVSQVLSEKDVDKDYVHPDLITVNYAPGSLAGEGMNAVDSYIQRLRQSITVGGKSIPLLMADNESLAESQADRSLETYVDGTITPIQERESEQWSAIFDLANQAQGIRGRTQILFQKRRVRDLKEIADTEKVSIENILTKLENNFITQEEATQQIQQLRDPLIV